MTASSSHTVVTGSASGLGAALVELLSAEGRTVIGVDVHDADVVADLGTVEGRSSAVAEVLRRSGGRLDGVVSCAGVSPLHPDPATVVSVNWFGAMAVLDGLRPALEAGTDPAAVAISSIGAVDGTADDALVELLLTDDEPAARRAAADGTDYRAAICYSASKRAVGLGVRARAGEWGRVGVRLNAVAPGRMETPMLDGLMTDAVTSVGIDAYPTGLRPSGTAEDVGRAVRFLLGPDATFVHGQVLFVDGGTEALLRGDRL
jgi:NAD(P)-dependent dehydrogenase (short-subunit alcohol dehydrogenase family)